MTVMLKSLSCRLLQLPWRNSRHHRCAFRRVSGSGSSGRVSSLQCSSVLGWTWRAFSVTSRPRARVGEDETPLINLVFILGLRKDTSAHARRSCCRGTSLGCDAGRLCFVVPLISFSLLPVDRWEERVLRSFSLSLLRKLECYVSFGLRDSVWGMNRRRVSLQRLRTTWGTCLFRGRRGHTPSGRSLAD